SYSNIIATSTLATSPLNASHSETTLNSITWTWQSGGGQKEYYAWTVTPSSSSGWITGTSWTLYELLPNTSYTMFVKARNWNDVETVEISTYAYTSIEQPTGVDFGTITESSIQAKPAGTFTNLSSLDSAIITKNITKGTESGWIQDTSYWNSTGLSPNTTYYFEVNSRNQIKLENTPVGAYKSTLCKTPGIPTLTAISSCSINVVINTNGNPYWTTYSIKFLSEGTTYYVQTNKTLSTSPEIYQSTITWAIIDVTGLNANTKYAVSVSAKNNEDIKTDYGPSATKYTLAQVPSITCNKSTGTWYNVAQSSFTSNWIFGTDVEYYRYAWNMASTYTWTGDESQWSTGNLITISTADGSWYLHLKSYNAEDEENTISKDFGPYSYDSSSPTITMDFPVSGSWYNIVISSYYGSITETGGSGIDLATLKYNYNGTGWTSFNDDSGPHDWDDINDI
ncbi:MAG: hypothetical protein QME68_08405, partial [Elusimicrobiota bacterium]|nr:hypothetical protein [Elusimicrobiota bacterium]